MYTHNQYAFKGLLLIDVNEPDGNTSSMTKFDLKNITFSENEIYGYGYYL